ncbi:hypothetical protein AG1IA_04700 [Rhizoctonia solani AG-1 IA]|uniref:Uncharacterized protein n=1 Tax=Thanatephorus cucumeris (strain AG1-IA) TaxID=983506 RepID=L8WTJ3_THACA|nr:hypothetical protein AG1IA_04700 [Rhizoctonia solani AG-1 IA]
MSSTTSSAPAEPTSFEDDSPTKRSRVVLTATIGGVCILAVTIAFIAIRVTDEPILLETKLLNINGGNRQKRNAWDVQEWEGTPVSCLSESVLSAVSQGRITTLPIRLEEQDASLLLMSGCPLVFAYSYISYHWFLEVLLWPYQRLYWTKRLL